MKSNKTYAVFGLGRYGLAVARELVANGKEVIAVDMSQKIVNDVAAYLPICKCADVTDAEVISRLGIGNIDTVIICMAGNLEASVMAVTLCKEAGVNTVIAKCANEMHQKILIRVGADRVVFPENESGIRLAKNLLSSGFIDMISFLQANALYSVKPSLSESEAKAYIFVGEKENGAMRKSARIINESFKNSELQILPKAYHGQFSINNADDYVKTVLEITSRQGS